MKKFENLFMRTKLLLSFGAIWLLLLIVIVIAYEGFRRITQSEKELHDVHFVEAVELLKLRSLENFNRAAILDMMLVKDKKEQAELVKQIASKGDEIDDVLIKLSNVDTTDPLFERQLDELKSEMEKYRLGRKEEIFLIKNGEIDKAQTLGITTQKVIFERINSIAMQMGNRATKEANSRLINDIQRLENVVVIFVIIAIISFFISVLMIIVLNRTIAQSLNGLTKIATNIAAGDMQIELPPTKRTDEVGILLNAFCKMVNVLRDMAAVSQKIASGDLTGSIVPQSEKDLLGNSFLRMTSNMQRIMKEILDSVNLLGTSASEILAATTQVASAATQTVSSISETTSTVEEVRQAAELSSKKASRVSESSQQIAVVTQAGKTAVENNINGMNHIQSQMGSIAGTIIKLSEQSQQIGGIIASVNDVADQSNLLAVNASIEAAKAGEHGKGFAVVAQEIKNLALQSKQATVQVRNILNDVQKATSDAVLATEQGSKAVDNGMAQSKQAGDSIQLLSESVNDSVQASIQIAASSQQQVIGMDQVGIAMNNINQAGAENMASMRQAERAAKDLNELGIKLKELVAQYTI